MRQSGKIHKLFKQSHHSKNMKNTNQKRFEKLIEEAHNDPKIMREIKRFVKVATS